MLALLLLLVIVALVRIEAEVSAEQGHCVVKNAITVDVDDPRYQTKPNIDGAKLFYGGKILPYDGKSIPVASPIIDASTGQKTVIGTLAQMTTNDLPPVIDSAKQAWKSGQGAWPQMSPEERIAAIERVVSSLKQRRDDIVRTLMWEIAKTWDDAQLEFDRTMNFIEAAIEAYRRMDTEEGAWQHVGGIFAKVRRMAMGIILCLGPFNYPFNETYATLIPALLLGNIVIMKIPGTGGLAHLLTMESYAEHLPPGTINFISGAGRELLAPIMKTGLIDALAFIGGSKAADKVIAAHPAPHRLKVFLQLEGKNLGIVLPDADLDVAARQILVGSTSYNGQRCTAIKLILVHHSVANAFVERFVPLVEQLGFGLPWTPKVAITPLPEPNKVEYLTGLVDDALAHGASLLTSCEKYGETLLRPTVVFNVTQSMRLWHEEQFGPVIPIATYSSLEDILSLLRDTSYGQQAAVFTRSSTPESVSLLNALALSVGRININTQCGRSPDSLPFSGRRSSALGTMSVTEALKTFSVEVVLAAQDNAVNVAVAESLASDAAVFRPFRGQEGYIEQSANTGSEL